MDRVTPFLIKNLNIRGRMATLDDSVRAIIQRHEYPRVINDRLAELIVLGTTLAHAFKFDGIFTLQIQGGVDSLVSFMVVDIACGPSSPESTANCIRACAALKEDALDTLNAMTSANIFDLFKEGTMAFSLDLHPSLQKNEQRYQGIVELTSPRIQDCLQHYFRQSEQLETAFFTSIDPTDFTSRCIMIQTLPLNHNQDTHERDDWMTAVALLSTLTQEECKNLPEKDVLQRLFQTEGLSIHPSQPVMFQCRCSIEKLQPFMDQLTDEEKADIAKDGVIHVSCDFCGEKYLFPQHND